jgi:hypothetical protein
MNGFCFLPAIAAIARADSVAPLPGVNEPHIGYFLPN